MSTPRLLSSASANNLRRQAQVPSRSRSSKRAKVNTFKADLGTAVQADVDDDAVVFVCGNGDGVALVGERLAKKPYSLKLTDDPGASTYVVLVASKGIFQHTPTIKLLDQIMTANKKCMVLFETSQAHGGAPVEHFLNELHPNHVELKNGEWVPLYRSAEMLDASIVTALRQRNLAPHRQLDRVFVFFYSHHQRNAQGNVMTLYNVFNNMGLNGWLDMKANDLSTTGMLEGVNNSENFVLFLTDGYFTREYCLMELDEAVRLKKNIVVIFEEREKFGGASLHKLKAQVPDKYAFLADMHEDGSMKHGWIRLEVRAEFQRQMIDQLLKHCDIPPPNQEVSLKFSKVPDSTAVAQQKQACFLPSTRQSMFEAVEQWRADSGTGSNVFGILGQEGVGKSVFSAQLALADQHVVARHFFKHDDGDLSDPRQCIWSLAKQLRYNVPGFRRPFDERTKEAEQASEWTVDELFTRLIANPAELTPAPVDDGRMLVVVDALDECSESHTMASLLKDSWRKMPKWLGVVFTTRPSVVAFPETDAEANAQGVTVLNMENEPLFTLDGVVDPSLAGEAQEGGNVMLVSADSPATAEPTASSRPLPPNFFTAKAKVKVDEEAKQPVILVCGNGDGVTLLQETLAKKPYSHRLTDDPSKCTHVVLVASCGVFEHAQTLRVLDLTLAANKIFMVLFETDEAHDGGVSAQHSVQGRVPSSYKQLNESEWVPLYHSKQMLTASIVTALRQCDLAPFQECCRNFVMFLSYEQQSEAQGEMMTVQGNMKTVQGNMTALSGAFNEVGLKVWLDMEANDWSAQGRTEGVKNSENFLLFCTRGYFMRPNCLAELDQAISLEKRIVVLFEEREFFGGAPMDTLVADVPDKYAFLTDTQSDDGSMKHGWIKLEVRVAFQQQMIDQLLTHCAVTRPNHQILRAFAKVPDSAAAVRQNQAWFLPGTRQWMFDAVDEWRADGDGQGSQVFGVVGQAGVGKSVFAAQLASMADKHVAARYFFKHDDRDSTDAKQCIWSLAKQLRDNVPGFRKSFDAGTKAADPEQFAKWSLVECFQHLIADPACQTSNPYGDNDRRLFVVVDALDECSDSHAMVSLLKGDWRAKVPKWLGVLFTTRPDVVAFPKSEVEAKAQGLTVLNTEDASNIADVRLYLKDRVFTPDRVADQALVDKFVDAVTEKSQGLFLYLRFMDEVIGNILMHGRRFELQGQDLQAFPYGIGGIYNDYFGRLYAKLGADKYVKLLGSVLSAREPLPKELWMHAFGLVSDDLGHDDDESDNKELSEFVKLQQHCGNLLHIPGVVDHPLSNGVRFVHKSMMDYLTGGHKAKEETALKNPKFKHLHVEPSQRNKALAKPCLEAFQSGRCSNAAKEYASKHAFFHLCEAESFDQAEALLFNLRNLLQRLHHDSPTQMTSDAVAGLVKNENVADKDVKQSAEIVANVLRLGSVALSGEARELAGQVVGRLSRNDVAELPRALELWDQAWNFRDENGMPWLRPVKPCLVTAMPSALLRVISGHTSVVKSVALSPDGRTIASGSSDRTIRLWDAQTGEAKLGGKRLNGHVGVVSSVAFSPDSGTIASGSEDHTIRLWDAETGEAKLGGRQLKGHVGGVGSVTFSPDGGTIVSGSWDGTIRLWDAETGEAKNGEGAFQGGGDPRMVMCVAFSPDGSTIVSASWDKTLRLWEAETGRAKLGGRGLHGHEGSVTSVAFSPDSQTVVSGSADKTIRLWDAKTGAPKWEDRPSKGHTDSVRSVAFSTDGHTIVSGSLDNTIRLWDAMTGEAKNGGRPLGRHTSNVWSVVFSHDSQTIVSGGSDHTIRLWDATASEAKLGGEWSEGPTEEDMLGLFACSPDRRTIATGCGNFSIHLWDAKTGEAKKGSRPLEGHIASVSSVAFSPDGSTIASGSHDKTIRLWDAETGQTKLGGMLLKGHTSYVTCFAFSRDGTTIVSGSADTTIRLWDATTGEAKNGGRPLEGHTDSVWSIAFSPDGHTIVSGSADTTIRLWDAKTGEAKNGGQALEGHTDSVWSVAFSPDGHTIVSGSADKTIRLWDAETGEAKLGRQKLQGRTQFVKLGFSPDGRTIVCQFDDGTTALWDAESGEAKGLGGSEEEFNSCVDMLQGVRLESASDSAAWIPFTLDQPCHALRSWTSPSGESVSFFIQGKRQWVVELIRATPGTDTKPR